jgi:HEAT repeat protein
MLSTIEVVIYAFVLVLIPLAIFSLMRGSPPPEYPPLSKFYHAERYLNVVGNWFVLSICAHALGKLALHFGIIDASAADRVELVTSIPLLSLLVIYLGLWARAALKVRRLGKNGV